MVEAVSAATPKQFAAIQYNTKDGETITATKKDGVVTLVGDKSGVRQMPIKEFEKELIANAPKLEKTPAKDTVEISKGKDAKAPFAPKDTKTEEKNTKEVADAKKSEEPTKADKEVKTDKAPTEEKAPAPEDKKPEVGKKLDVAA